jgi:hypothetical protein
MRAAGAPGSLGSAGGVSTGRPRRHLSNGEEREMP